MGTRITALPPVATPTGSDELPISQFDGVTGRTTYKATLDQIKGYIGSGSGSVNSVSINSTDGSVGVFGSPITNTGTISLTVSSVGLDKLDDGGATGGEILTYNGSTSAWEPGYGGSSGIIPNILVGNGGATYTLTNYTNDAASNYLVFVGGVAQRPVTDFTISGSSIIFGSNIPSGVQILVYAVISIATLNLDATPIGTVSWFAASAAPTSYLECSGGIVAISDYTDLWYVIGTKYNTGGEGAGNFRLPDLRGEFIRGWDHGRNINAGRVFGSSEADELKTHTHKVSGTVGTNSLATAPIVVKMESYESTELISTYDSAISTGGSETRPRNVALLPCIKALKTVTGNVNTLNFIEKPASVSDGQVLTYNGSTSTWVASSLSANPFFRNTLIGEVTASPDGTVASYGSQIKGRYEIKYERGVIYQDVALNKAASFNVTFFVGTDPISSDFIKIGEPYIFDHSGGNITCYVYDSVYTDNTGTGFALSLWKLAPIFCNPQI
jgi:microcystin-dependent protein